MLTFPLSIFLIPFLLFILVIVFFTIITVKNLVKYRTEDFYAFIALSIFLGGMILIGYFSWVYLYPIDWKEPVEIALEISAVSF